MRSLFVALFLLASSPGFAGSRFTAPAPPAPPAPPKAPRASRAPLPPPPPDADDDDDDSDDDDLPGMSDLRHQLRDLPRAMALRSADDDDDEDDDDDRAERMRHDKERMDKDVRVYRMDKERFKDQFKAMKHQRFGNDDDEDEVDDRDATASNAGRGSATLPVRGPITLQLRAQAGDIEIVSSDRPQVAMTLNDAPKDDVRLLAFGDRVEATFRGRRELRRGKLHVEVPRGTRVDLQSMSGDLSVQRLGGDVRIRTMSGDVKLSGITKADVQTISGDVHLEDATGPVRLHTVSGHGIVNSSAAAPQVEFQSASGDLDWTGTCGRDCHISSETVSGDVKLALDPRSSFELSYTSHNGELRDELNLAVKHPRKTKHGEQSGWLEATYGRGEGVVECDAFSGSLQVRKR